MKIRTIGEQQIIMSNPHSKHNYFAWPTAVRLQNGKIAVVASGFRLRHICPFGKTVISYSEDNGNTYTAPAPVFDTVLDDRDGGIMTFGERGVVVTSFNNTVEFQRQNAKSDYDTAYLDTVSSEAEQAALGSSFRISLDGGVTFCDIFKSPVTSPHGPVELSDGSLLWVGRMFSPYKNGDGRIEAHKINLDGSTEFVGYIEDIRQGDEVLLSCEPHTVALEDGTLLTHIRVQTTSGEPMLTIYQSESYDGGKSWTQPHPLLDKLGGAPPHIFKHSSGMLICTYGCREKPYSIKAMFSRDSGRSWSVDHDICINGVSLDLGYPSTVELDDGSLITVFYAHAQKGTPAVIMQQRWTIEE